MPKYYEQEALIEFVKKYSANINGETTLKCVEIAIRNAPTEDVVPRAEVAYKLELLDVYKQNCGEIYITDNGGISPLNTIVIDHRVRYLPMEFVTLIKQAKQEVAKQIFDMVKKRIHNEYNDLSNIVPTDDDYYLGKLAGLSEAEISIAEIEKKYIGE